MVAASSWLQSLLSQSKLLFSSQRLRKYGFALSDFLTGAKTGQKSVKDSFQANEDGVRMKCLTDLDDVEKIIGYKFINKTLLNQAFTHPSYNKGCASYERLEYLARVAVKHNLHKYLRHGKPALERRIQRFMEVLPKYPLHSHGLIDAPKVLADVVESTIGAVFIDSNTCIDTTWEVTSILLDPIITPEMLQINPVKKLYELCQKYKLTVRLVDLWSKEGAFEVFVNNHLRGRGHCHAKKEIALNRAANAAYNEVLRILRVEDINTV
ncbi:ribonuclease 3-like protein 3 isoform X3 [Coffea arabica]|uniref:Ribonuclease 3-like protein 3 isoform X3 n=1 Tax=Coffea arabica TaxID=13443 RepID=A0A6P6SG01_COFAR|nr:ribonuclease 3-like protein 3 isoform X3 [Coffea arabica]XP_027064749.1 ribonuclease 3-like protein 3 isoform X3 [Coffea arabica]